MMILIYLAGFLSEVAKVSTRRCKGVEKSQTADKEDTTTREMRAHNKIGSEKADVCYSFSWRFPVCDSCHLHL